MASLNRVILIGHLGKDPEVRYLPSGKAVANVSLATSESWKDKETGEKQQRTEWHRVTFYSPLAEIVERYLKKGALIYIEGRLQTHKWQDKNGQDRYTTEVIVNEMKMLGGKEDRAAVPPPAPSARSTAPPVPRNPRHTASMQAQAPVDAGEFDDDIPF